MKEDKATVWKAWFPLPDEVDIPKVKVKPSDVDWFADRGIADKQLHGALLLLGIVRKKILPLIHDDAVRSLTFLVHEYPKGKTSIDLTIELKSPVGKDSIEVLVKSGWVDIKPSNMTSDVAGINSKSLKYRQGASKIVSNLSMAYLRMLDAFSPRTTDVELLKQVGQGLHFLANMSQLTIS